MPTMYKRIGCGQEDHISNCIHFGYFGTYLSEHSEECKAETNEGRNNACICNPNARKKLPARTHHLRIFGELREMKDK